MTLGRNEDLTLELFERPSNLQVIKLYGPLILRTLFEFQEAARREGMHSIVVDLGGVPYIDSAGLGAIISVLAHCQRTSRKFAIVGRSDRVRTLFEMTGVDGLIPCFATLEVAETELGTVG